MKQADESPPTPVLKALGLDAGRLLGQGSEAWVYALDAQRIIRINRPGTSWEHLHNRSALLAELGRSAHKVPFALPQVLGSDVVGGLTVTIERRLAGRPMMDALGEAAGAARAALIRAYLEASAQIGELAVKRRWYGDLLQPLPLHTATFRAYLEQRARRSLQAGGQPFAAIDPASLAGALPEPQEAALVHLDFFPGNVLVEGEAVTAVLDFGSSAILGDRRLDPLAAAAYLDAAISPTAVAEDRVVVGEWLATRNLSDLYDPARRWVAAYWAFAVDDISLQQWCQEVLLS